MTGGYMTKDHHDLIKAIGNYGIAQQEFGKKGGYKTEEGRDCQDRMVCIRMPVDKEAHQKACNAWGDVMDILDKHFRKGFWRTLFEKIFGD